MRTPPLHASPARCHDECKTPGAVRPVPASTGNDTGIESCTAGPSTASDDESRSVAWFERGSIERRYAHFRALEAGLNGAVAQVRQFRCEIVS